MLPDCSTLPDQDVTWIAFRGRNERETGAIVDADQYSKLRGYCWYVTTAGYVVRNTSASERRDGFPKHVSLHRVILGLELTDGRVVEVDHVNGNPLDNRRSNLRAVPRLVNQVNRPGRAGASRFRGVVWCRQTGRWRAQIKSDGTNRHIGRYDREEDAARAYDREARRLWGDVAWLNFPPPNHAQHAGGRVLVEAAR